MFEKNGKTKVVGVFTRISGGEKKVADWDVFRTGAKAKASKMSNGSKKSRILAKLERYAQITQSEQFINIMNELSELEHDVLQNLCTVRPKITMGTLRQTRNNSVVDYLIARAPFPFKDKNRNEFRMYLGKMQELPYATVEDVCKDTDFMLEVEKKVISAMNDIITGKTNPKVYMGNNP